jgi:hypothetical protein
MSDSAVMKLPYAINPLTALQVKLFADSADPASMLELAPKSAGPRVYDQPHVDAEGRHLRLPGVRCEFP